MCIVEESTSSRSIREKPLRSFDATVFCTQMTFDNNKFFSHIHVYVAPASTTILWGLTKALWLIYGSDIWPWELNANVDHYWHYWSQGLLVSYLKGNMVLCTLSQKRQSWIHLLACVTLMWTKCGIWWCICFIGMRSTCRNTIWIRI